MLRYEDMKSFLHDIVTCLAHNIDFIYMIFYVSSISFYVIIFHIFIFCGRICWEYSVRQHFVIIVILGDRVGGRETESSPREWTACWTSQPGREFRWSNVSTESVNMHELVAWCSS